MNQLNGFLSGYSTSGKLIFMRLISDAPFFVQLKMLIRKSPIEDPLSVADREQYLLTGTDLTLSNVLQRRTLTSGATRSTESALQ